VFIGFVDDIMLLFSRKMLNFALSEREQCYSLKVTTDLKNDKIYKYFS